MAQRNASLGRYKWTTVLFFFFAIGATAQAPVINSFAPQSGPIGTKVIITGNNFGSSPTQNIVYFGSVLAVVSAASINSLTVYVPIGASYHSISVTTNLLTAYSAAAFVVTKNIAQNITATSFASHADFAVSASPEQFSIADYDGNGVADITLVTNATGFVNLSVFRNTADCKNLSFGAEQLFYSGSTQPKGGMVSADLDGDGKLDVVISETGDKIVTIHQNTSNPASLYFNNGQGLTVNTLPIGDLKIADMDGDGKPDIVVALYNALAPTSGVAIYRNTSTNVGTFSFSAPQTITFLSNPKNIALSDLDGDGKQEIITSDGLLGVHVRRNISVSGTLDNTSFDVETSFATAINSQSIVAGELDGDGKTDLAVACGSAISILRNTSSLGTISFANHIDLTGVVSTSIDLGDLNGDGKVDIAVNNGTNISVLQNQSTSGSISFGAKFGFSAGAATVNEIEIADMNDDGYLDIAAITSGNLFSVFLYNPPIALPPIIASLSSSTGLINTAITITGDNFGNSIATNRVYFGAVKGTVTSASTTQLIVSVPAYATFGPITVENITENLSADSQVNFTPLFDNNKDFGGRIIPASMAAKVDINIGSSNASTVNLGDIDGDGYSDLIVSGASNDSLIIYRNKGNKIIGSAGFEKTGLYFSADGNHTAIAKDIDDDGKLDLVMIVRGLGDQDEILIYHNESSPGALSAASFGPVFQVHLAFLHINNSELNIADLDGDGKPDLICENSGVISVFKNNSEAGSFCFAPSVDIAGAGGQTISVGDIDGDGKLDLVVAGGYYGLSGFNIIHNTSVAGLLSFGAPVLFGAMNGNITDVELTDLDNDGKPDINWVGPNAAGLALHVMRNTSTSGTIDASSFAAEIDYVWESGFYGPGSHSKVADMNGDGKPDIVTCDGYLGIFENASSTGVIDGNSFLPGVTFNIPVNYSAQYPAIGDLDGDGKPEVVAAVSSYSTSVISIFRNETYPAPQIDLLKNSSATIQSGVVGSAIFTQGDFQFTNSDNPLIRFGSTASTINSVTNNTVSSYIPAGASNERVAITLHGLTGFSPLPFNQTFATTGVIDATTFSTGVDFSLITAATKGLAVADLDNDGKPDVVTGDGGNINIMKSNLASAGVDVAVNTFSQVLPEISASIGTSPIAISDIDGDGLMDLAASASVYRNNSGTQVPPVSFEAGVQGLIGSYPNVGRRKANIDFNHDGKNDQVATSNDFVFINENHSTKGSFYAYAPFSTFATSLSFPSTGILGEASAGDFDGDGYDDIVFLNQTNSQFITMMNKGVNREITTASFGPQQVITTATSPYFIFVSDFNLDGKLDVAVGFITASVVSVYQNTSTVGNILFSKQDFATLANVVGLDAADLDGDGKPEIVTIHGNGSSGFDFSILKNTSFGNISFASKIDYALTTQPQGLALADVNLDSKADILISRSPAIISIFQNQLKSINVIAIETQPKDLTVCAGTTAIFSVAATGTTNITYQWQFSSAQAGTYNDISEGNGYANVATSNLSVSTNGNFGARFYRCKINGDLAAQIISNTAQLTITNVPTNPTTTGGTTCNGGTVILTASGGSDGNYKWYTDPAGGIAIAGAVDGIYTATDLSVTTNYYVSINNGTCESARAEVTATVLGTVCSGSAPVIKTEILSTTIGGTIVLDLAPLITVKGSVDIHSIRIISAPMSGAVATIENGVLTISYANRTIFSGEESITIEACDQSGMCAQQEFTIQVSDPAITVYNGVSPNTDKKNDFFNILNIELLQNTKNNQVTIYNRWGDEVFSVSGYDNNTKVFLGLSNAGNKLPAGIYFYKIEMPDANKTLKGYLSLRY